MAESLNDYFTSVVRRLVEKLPGQTRQYSENHVQQYYSQQGIQADGFSLTQVSEAIVHLRCSTSSAAPKQLVLIIVRFLKDVAEIITPCITHIVNLAIEQGLFPSDLKLARVIPLNKKGSKLDHGNNKPVSIVYSV